MFNRLQASLFRMYVAQYRGRDHEPSRQHPKTIPNQASKPQSSVRSASRVHHNLPRRHPVKTEELQEFFVQQ